jgi:hypothetical protein
MTGERQQASNLPRRTTGPGLSLTDHTYDVDHTKAVIILHAIESDEPRLSSTILVFVSFL